MYSPCLVSVIHLGYFIVFVVFEVFVIAFINASEDYEGYDKNLKTSHKRMKQPKRITETKQGEYIFHVSFDSLAMKSYRALKFSMA